MLRRLCVLPALILVLASLPMHAGERTLRADDYYDKVRGAWVGSLVGQASGIELQYDSTPVPMDTLPGFVVRGEWQTDDDHSMEWGFLHMMEANGLDEITYQQMASEWLDHITRDIWYANAVAYSQMKDGVLPPQTGKGSTYIDGQIECEVFGMIAPGMIRNALDREDYWGRVVADRHALDAARFYSALCAEAYFETNAEDLVRKVLSYYDPDCQVAQEVSCIIAWHRRYPRWQDARQRVYHSVFYDGAIMSACNFGVTIIALLYGESDWKRTVEIAALGGWDGDCNASTAAAVMGIMKGYSGLPPNVKAAGNIYRNTSRDNLPSLDSLTGISARCQALAEQNILARGGTVTGSGADRRYTIIDGAFIPPVKPDSLPPPPPGNLTPRGFIIASSITPYNGGNSDIESVRDGVADFPSCYRVNADSSRPVYLGYSYGTMKKFTRLVYQEGYGYFNLGGWFANGTLRVQVRRDTVWVDAATTPIPPYPNGNDPSMFTAFATYTFAMDSVLGDGIRIIGESGGQDPSRTYVNIAELHVWGIAASPATDIEALPSRGATRSTSCRPNCPVLLAAFPGHAAVPAGAVIFTPDGRRIERATRSRGDQAGIYILRSPEAARQ